MAGSTLFREHLLRRQQDLMNKQATEQAQQDRALWAADREDKRRHEHEMRGMEMAREQAKHAAILGRERLKLKKNAQQELADMGYDEGLIADLQARRASEASDAALQSKFDLEGMKRSAMGLEGDKNRANALKIAGMKARAAKDAAAMRKPAAKTPADQLVKTLFSIAEQGPRSLAGVQFNPGVMPQMTGISQRALNLGVKIDQARAAGRELSAEDMAEANEVFGALKSAGVAVPGQGAPQAPQQLDPEEDEADALFEQYNTLYGE